MTWVSEVGAHSGSGAYFHTYDFAATEAQGETEELVVGEAKKEDAEKEG